MQNLILGSHIAVSRGFYTHHGIYIGGDKVVHYSGFAQAFKKGAAHLATARFWAANQRDKEVLPVLP